MLISLCINAIWVLGLSGLFAALSFAHWWKLAEQITWRAALDRRALQRAVDVSLLIFGLGQLLVASVLDVHTVWPQVAIWALFVLIFTGKLAFANQATSEQ